MALVVVVVVVVLLLLLFFCATFSPVRLTHWKSALHE